MSRRGRGRGRGDRPDVNTNVPPMTPEIATNASDTPSVIEDTPLTGSDFISSPSGLKPPERAIGRTDETTSGSLPLWDRFLYFAAIIAPLVFLLFTHTASPAPVSREVRVLVETPTLADLAADSVALSYYAEQGVSGVVLKPSTLGGLAAGRELALASGAEIVRLFRLEGIVNIFMWEQIRDKPVRPDATYIFTDQLIVFETIQSALVRQLGATAVRPYNDGEHDFGGDIPGNFILEVLAPIDEVRGYAVGMEGAVRERLQAAGLDPVIDVASVADVRALPEPPPTLLVSANPAAEALYAERHPGIVLLERGVRNPGWADAVLAERPTGETLAISGGAIVVPLADAGRFIAQLKTRGFRIHPAATPSSPQATTLAPQRTWAGPLGLALLASILAWSLTRLRPGTKQRGLVVLAWGGSALLWLATRSFFPEVAGGALVVVVVAGVLRRHRPSIVPVTRLETALQVLLGVSALLMAGQLIAVGRPAPDPWTLALVALAVAAAWHVPGARSNSFLLAALAIAASRIVPTLPLLLILFIPLSLSVERVATRPELAEAVRWLTWPAGLALLLNQDLALSSRAAAAIVIAASLIGSLYLPPPEERADSKRPRRTPPRPTPPSTTLPSSRV